MKGITFDTVHSYREWGLLLTSCEVGSPTIKLEEVDKQGADGRLDFTDYFGSVKYDNRTLKFELSKGGVTPAGFLDLVSDIQDKLHGQRKKVVLDYDEDYYYIGRVKINDFICNRGIGRVTIEVDAQPYKYKNYLTTVIKAVTGTANITLTNSRMPVVPQITTTASMTIAFNGSTYAVGAGTSRIPELQLEEGDNILTVTGTGNITFDYQEGRL